MFVTFFGNDEVQAALKGLADSIMGLFGIDMSKPTKDVKDSMGYMADRLNEFATNKLAPAIDSISKFLDESVVTTKDGVDISATFKNLFDRLFVVIKETIKEKFPSIVETFSSVKEAADMLKKSFTVMKNYVKGVVAPFRSLYNVMTGDLDTGIKALSENFGTLEGKIGMASGAFALLVTAIKAKRGIQSLFGGGAAAQGAAGIGRGAGAGARGLGLGIGSGLRGLAGGLQALGNPGSWSGIGVLATGLLAVTAAVNGLAFAFDMAKDGFEPFGNMIATVLPELLPFVEEFGEVFLGVFDKVDNIIETVSDGITGFVDSITGLVTGTLESIKGILAELGTLDGTNMILVGTGLLSVATGLAALTASSLVENISSFVKGLFTDDTSPVSAVVRMNEELAKVDLTPLAMAGLSMKNLATGLMSAASVSTDDVQTAINTARVLRSGAGAMPNLPAPTMPETGSQNVEQQQVTTPPVADEVQTGATAGQNMTDLLIKMDELIAAVNNMGDRTVDTVAQTSKATRRTLEEANDL